ncbi:S1 family peptidase [Rhodohalobacter sp. 8-1]|uniref:S1 family peptidase n=1 Tax=Rhodohalobacter sp. 8-1 TaxID=3131972 RepID=UPI0030EBC703
MSDSELIFPGKKSLLQIGIIIGVLLFTGCSTSERIIFDDNETSYYRSSTGSDVIREQLKNSLKSIKRVQNEVVYQTYYFDELNPPRWTELRGVDFETVADHSKMENHSTAGSALTMSNRGGRIALLTAAHIVSFPDTIWTFADESEPDVEKRVNAVSVQESVNHFVYSDDRIIIFDVVVTDPDRDLAVLIRDMGGDRARTSLETLAIPPGNANQMDWTDMVYAVGYPKGIQMVTRGMLSKASFNPRRRLILDASFNPGFSGGALFAVRSDGSGLEWVGLVIMASAEREQYVGPEEIADGEYQFGRIYEGPLYVQSSFRLNYGITFAIDINEIGNFFRDYEEELRQEDIRVPKIQ